MLLQTNIQKQQREQKLTSKRLCVTAANNSYAFMEGQLANHKEGAGNIRSYSSNNL